MTRMGKMSLSAAAAALMAAAAFAPASAAPAMSPAATQGLSQATTDNIQQVGRRGGYRRHGGWHGRRHRGGGGGWGWGAAGLATGLLLSSPYWAGDYGYAEPSYAYGDDGFERCQQTFRSFDPSSGTYVGYDGLRRRCPYI